MQQGIQTSITSVVSVIGFLAIMFYLSPSMTLIAVITVPLSLVLVTIVIKLSQKHFKNQQKEIGKLNSHVEEMFAGHNIIKAYNLEEKSIDKLSGINKKLYRANWKATFLSGLMMPLMTFVGNLGYVAVCVLGGTLVIQGKLGIGGIQSFMQYIRRFNQPISQLAQISNLFQSTIAAAERVFEFLEANEELKNLILLLKYKILKVTFLLKM